jgi:hypothetical protein
MTFLTRSHFSSQLRWRVLRALQSRFGCFGRPEIAPPPKRYREISLDEWARRPHTDRGQPWPA